MSTSRIVQEALADYLQTADRPEARDRVLQILRSRRPLGPAVDWAAVHRERTESDADRS